MLRHVAPEVITEIYPETVSRRKLPVNFNQDHIALFDLELQRSIPPSQLVRFQNIRVSPDGIFFVGTKILPESFAFPWILEEWKSRSILKFLATNHFVRRRRRINNEVLWITDFWSTGYFHWLTDALTRLFVVRDRLDHLALMLPSGYETRDFVTSSLKAFQARAVDFIRPNETIECGSLLTPTHTAPSGNFNDKAIRGVRSVLLSAFGDSSYQGPGERIYISRRRADKRRIVNEDDIHPILSKFGFQIVCAEDLSFEEQVKMCSRARYIVSNHGAGLTNILFMKDGGSVLELRHHLDRIHNCYFVMSSALNFNYFYQACPPHDHDEDPHTADVLVDPDELEKQFCLLLA
jgi:hypothetical protein